MRCGDFVGILQVKKAASEAAGEVPAAGFAERATVQDILRQVR